MRIDVLDHGYVQLVETWGSDERIIEAARMSTAKGFQGWGQLDCPACECADPSCTRCKGTGYVPGDEKLLRYLYEHKHMTPFEMAGMIVEVQAPIFVFREWHRHRTQSYNELSARYTPLPDVNYVPDVAQIIERIANAGTNKQAQGVDSKTVKTTTEYWQQVEEWLGDLDRSYRVAQDVYSRGLALGIPKELARLPVPVGRYSRMRASANLRNWLAFLTLRMDPAAQLEIREYAIAVHQILSQHFSKTMELFNA